MIWRWRYYLAAALFAGYFLVSRGAPPLGVILGLAVAALIVWRQLSRSVPHSG